jgi:hypothetical protein
MTDEPPSGDAPDIAQLLATLIAEVKDPERLIELYYWSLEPELAATVRFLLGMEAKARETIYAFCGVSAPESVKCRIGQEGEVTLSGSGGKKMLALNSPGEISSRH